METKPDQLIEVKDLLKDASKRNAFFKSYIDGGFKNDKIFINKLKPSRCPYCGGNHIKYETQSRNGINIYCCEDCLSHFSVTTNTVFSKIFLPLRDWAMFLNSLIKKNFLTNSNSNLFPKYDQFKFISLAKLLTRINERTCVFRSNEVEMHLFSYPDKKGNIDKPKNNKDINYSNYILAFVSDKNKLKAEIVGAGFCNPITINNLFRNSIKEESILVTKPFKAFDSLIFNLNLRNKIILGNDEDLKDHEDIYRGVILQDQFYKFLKVYKVKGMNLLLEYYLRVFEFIYKKKETDTEKIAFILSLFFNNYLVSDYENFLRFKNSLFKEKEWQ